MKEMDQNLKIFLRRFSSVMNAILKYSSPVNLNTGARFRVHNICGTKLPLDLSTKHKKHLKTRVVIQDLNYDLFCRQLWDHKTPLFVLEEKKVFVVILPLLIAASRMYESKRDITENVYAQNVNGINKPVMALKHHGPEIQRFASHDAILKNMKSDLIRGGIKIEYRENLGQCPNYG